MIGPSERPSRPPRENRKALRRDPARFDRDLYRHEYASLVLFYAAKIAAVYLFAAKHEVSAIVAAIRSEESTALKALRERQALEFARRRTQFNVSCNMNARQSYVMPLRRKLGRRRGIRTPLPG